MVKAITQSLLIVLLTGCVTAPLLVDFNPTAQDCIGYGVAAEGEPTGRIVAEHNVYMGELHKNCWHLDQMMYGCSKEIAPHEYEIWYAAPLRSCIPQHEACHAIYEAGHTERFNARAASGDMYAACPTYGNNQDWCEYPE